LSQVAPVPFAPEFQFGAQITAKLQEHVALTELEIRVSGVDRPIYRPHHNVFGSEEKHEGVFETASFVEIPAIDGKPAAIGWVLHHDYEGAIPTDALVKGLRLRSGNIQVGDPSLLEELFVEPRFNAWAVGEVQGLLRMEKIAGIDLLATEAPEATRAVIVELRLTLGRLMDDETAVRSPLDRLPKAQRTMYERFFELVYQCSSNRVAAAALVDRILLKVN